MNLRNFFAELKRRNVSKVAVAYAVVGWLVIQVSATVLPMFHAPEWIVQTLVLLVVLGFPIALVIAWAFEMTPEGIKRTENVSPDAALPSWSRSKFLTLIIGIAAIAGALLAFQLFRKTPAPNQTAAVDKSVAVLPFENFNRDPENAYFADGIQDEILTRLAKIDDLKVISRTSTQRYKSSPENLPEIAKQLGVAHILEGSVQKAGEKVRVTVQLIRASTDSHVWAETYDRKLTDIFAVESEIAESIAKSLRAKLTPGEKQAVATKPTENAEAYDAYLHGLVLWNGLSVSPETLQKAEEFFSRAVQLDPQFALAWASLSVVQTFVFAEYDPTAQRLANTKRSLDRATQLQPDIGDRYFALGLYRYRGLRDYDGTLEAFQEALDRGVNKAMSLEFTGYVKRRQGKWDETLALHAESAALDPRNTIIFAERAVTYRGLRRFDQAEGDFASAEKLIEKLPVDRHEPQLIGMRYNQYICARRYTDAARLLEGFLINSESLPKHLVATYRSLLGLVKRWAGDAAGAAQEFSSARAAFKDLQQASEKGEGFLENIIVLEALLGNSAAVDEIAVGLQPLIQTDAFYGPVLEEAIAQARAQLGETDGALTILRGLLAKPGENCITTALLRADPIWDPLRNDPRFQELAGKKQ